VEDKVGQLPDEKFAGSFTSGQVAMTPSWTSFLSALTPKTNPKLATFKWDVMGYPVQHAGEKWPNQFANGSQMGSLVKGTKHLTEAFQVGKYFIGDGHVVRMEAMGAPPIVINNAKQQDVWKQRAPGTHYTEVYSADDGQGQHRPVGEDQAELGQNLHLVRGQHHQAPERADGRQRLRRRHGRLR